MLEQPSSGMKRLELLVAQSDLEQTFVVGCWEVGILDVLGWEEIEQIQTDMKKQWYPDGTIWRSVYVDVPEDKLMEAFRSAIVEGKVVRDR